MMDQFVIRRAKFGMTGKLAKARTINQRLRVLNPKAH